ncbi:hypothetical protein DPMN_115581 [Dreissena polymorpha]|uniref:Uncharacterized protein n=1 Tax=Dreissena polymorpha TaxID=45954 RepID=A0A9D4KLI6_DREPO|nr:hypothetical protein DPMN_115581 [Dreissena polymorpha]
MYKVPVPCDFFGYVWDNRMSTNHRFSVVERSKHSLESPNSKPPTHGKENISVAANLFLEIEINLSYAEGDVRVSELDWKVSSDVYNWNFTKATAIKV